MKQEIKAKAIEEVNAVLDEGKIQGMYKDFYDAMLRFDSDTVVDIMINMYGMFTAETMAVFGVFLQEAQDKFSDKIIELNDEDMIEKAEKIADIFDELEDSDD